MILRFEKFLIIAAATRRGMNGHFDLVFHVGRGQWGVARNTLGPLFLLLCQLISAVPDSKLASVSLWLAIGGAEIPAAGSFPSLTPYFGSSAQGG